MPPILDQNRSFVAVISPIPVVEVEDLDLSKSVLVDTTDY